MRERAANCCEENVVLYLGNIGGEEQQGQKSTMYCCDRQECRISRTSNIQNKLDILQYIMTNESQNQASTFQSRSRPYCTAQRRDDAEHIYASGPNVFPSIRSMPWSVCRKSLRTPQW